MKGFKNTTRTQYFTDGDVGGYAKGGMAKAAKPAKAKAPMKKNEGGKVGKMPPLGESAKSGNRMSKMTAAEMRALEARFGEKKRPSPADSVRSANRISAQEGADARRFGVFNEGGKVRKYAEGGPARKTMPPSAPMPDLNETMSNLRNQFGVMGSSGQYDMKGLQDLVNNVGEVYRQRGATSDQVKNAYMQGLANLQKTPSGVGSAPGGPARPSFDASAAYQKFGADLKGMIDSGQLTLEQANALKAPAFEATRLRDVGQQQQAMQAALAAARGRMVPPVAQPQMPMAGPGGGNRDFYDRQVSPEQRARNEAGMADGSYAAYYQQATGQPLPQQPLQQQPLQQQPMQQMPLRAPQQVRPEPPRMQAMRGIQKMANRQRGFR